MNAQTIQITLIVVVVVIMVVVAAFRDNDAAAEYAAETHGHQHQRKDSFHIVPPLAFVKSLYLECRLLVCLCVTRRVF
jgi:heme/copper-type cytochrome/quinol oxidase subunit 2